MRLLLALLFYGLASVASSAERPFSTGDVFLCDMEEHVGWDWQERKFKRYTIESFKFTISDRNTIVFDQSENSFNNLELNIASMNGTVLKADNNSMIVMTVQGTRFNFVTTFYDTSSLVAATCIRTQQHEQL